jgi:DNA-binding HxlR family transcriptional regulator
MVRLGLLKKVPSRSRRGFTNIFLTEEGRLLYPVLMALVRWGNAWVVEGAQPSIREHVPYGRRRE